MDNIELDVVTAVVTAINASTLEAIADIAVSLDPSTDLEARHIVLDDVGLDKDDDFTYVNALVSITFQIHVQEIHGKLEIFKIFGALRELFHRKSDAITLTDHTVTDIQVQSTDALTVDRGGAPIPRGLLSMDLFIAGKEINNN